MGMTAENVAETYKISREDQDIFALESQKRAKAAIMKGRFQEEIIPVQVNRKKESFQFTQDEHPRFTTTLDKLATLKPAFKPNGTVTAGNACGRNDGAAALVMMKRQKAQELGLKPLAKIVDWAVSGVSPKLWELDRFPQ